MRGRVYDPILQRFLTPDPVTVHAVGEYSLRGAMTSSDPLDWLASDFEPLNANALSGSPLSGLLDRVNSAAEGQGAPGGMSAGMSDGTTYMGPGLVGPGASFGSASRTPGAPAAVGPSFGAPSSSESLEGFNPYAYAYNNPTNFVDPDGYDPVGVFAGGPGAGFHIPIPFGGGAYFTPGGVRAGAANFVITVAWNHVAGELAGAGPSPPQFAATNGDPKDKSEVVGKLAAAAAWIIAKETGAIEEVAGAIKAGTSGGDRAGKDFTRKGKAEIDAENAARHGGKNVCENCGRELVPAQKSQPGVTPPGNERHRDHIHPKSEGGDGSPSNGQDLCRDCNLEKSNKVP